MKVWVIQFDDQDYYCEGNHLLGVFSTQEEAHEAVEKNRTREPLGPPSYEYTIFSVDVDEVLEP